MRNKANFRSGTLLVPEDVYKRQVQADAEPDDIALRERKFFRSVHQFCANSPAPAALQYAEIDEFRTCLLYTSRCV